MDVFDIQQYDGQQTGRERVDWAHSSTENALSAGSTMRRTSHGKVIALHAPAGSGVWRSRGENILTPITETKMNIN